MLGSEYIGNGPTQPTAASPAGSTDPTYISGKREFRPGERDVIGGDSRSPVTADRNEARQSGVVRQEEFGAVVINRVGVDLGPVAGFDLNQIVGRDIGFVPGEQVCHPVKLDRRVRRRVRRAGRAVLTDPLREVARQRGLVARREGEIDGVERPLLRPGIKESGSSWRSIRSKSPLSRGTDRSRRNRSSPTVTSAGTSSGSGAMVASPGASRHLPVRAIFTVVNSVIGGGVSGRRIFVSSVVRRSLDRQVARRPPRPACRSQPRRHPLRRPPGRHPGQPAGGDRCLPAHTAPNTAR